MSAMYSRIDQHSYHSVCLMFAMDGKTVEMDWMRMAAKKCVLIQNIIVVQIPPPVWIHTMYVTDVLTVPMERMNHTISVTYSHDVDDSDEWRG